MQCSHPDIRDGYQRPTRKSASPLVRFTSFAALSFCSRLRANISCSPARFFGLGLFEIGVGEEVTARIRDGMVIGVELGRGATVATWFESVIDICDVVVETAGFMTTSSVSGATWDFRFFIFLTLGRSFAYVEVVVWIRGSPQFKHVLVTDLGQRFALPEPVTDWDLTEVRGRWRSRDKRHPHFRHELGSAEVDLEGFSRAFSSFSREE